MSIFKRGWKTVEPKELSFEEALGKIREKADFAEASGYDFTKLHCGGCINTCLLSKARCDLGRRVVSAVEKEKSNGV